VKIPVWIAWRIVSVSAYWMPTPAPVP